MRFATVTRQGTGAHRAGHVWDLQIDGQHQGTFETRTLAAQYAADRGAKVVDNPRGWERRDGGYMRRDGAWFLERGARMSGGTGTAWLIYRRVDDEARIGRDSYSIYDTRNGMVLWSVDETGWTDAVDPDYTGDLYAHDLDAGSLTEAKYAVQCVEQREAAKV